MKKSKIQTLSKEAIKKLIKKNNEAFKKASPEQRRVMVVKDALEQVKLGVFEARSGTYVELSPKYSDEYSGEVIEQKLSPQACVLNKELECTVCAKGALFMSHLGFKNKYSFAELNGDTYVDVESHASGSEKSENGFEKLFSVFQIDLIEQAFEADNCGFSSMDYWDNEVYRKEIKTEDEFDELVNNAYKFGKKYRGDKNRLIAILENIIENKGTFVPKLPAAKKK